MMYHILRAAAFGNHKRNNIPFPGIDVPLWDEEMKRLGNREALAQRLEFHGTIFVKEAAKNTGLSPQTVIKHFDSLVADGVAVRSTRWEGAYHINKEQQ